MDIQFVVTDKAHQYKGTVIANSSELNLVCNKAHYVEFTVDDDHRMLEHLVAEGARVRVMVDGVQEMAGPVEKVRGTFPSGSVVVTVFDDFLALSYALAWAVPTAAITAQSTQEYRRYEGVSELVAKTAISEASTRLGLGWTVAASAGRGTDVRVDTRFHPLADKILDGLNKDRLWLSVVTDEVGAVTVDVTEPTVFDRPLTLETGVLDGGEWSLSAPTASRVIVGGAGEGTARAFGQFVDTARESAWGFKREVFVDARNSEPGADLSEDATAAFEEGAAKASIGCDLSESSWFRYRSTYQLGDVVTIQIGPVEITDAIRTVTITESPDQGVTVVPRVGEIAESTEAVLAQAIARLARNVRDQGRR